ncbi:MAG: NADH-quinone oxidoreductase subunit L [Acidobacteriota bacterium]|nr:NADH-quinone oxidoreductase subunit L [Acidobacteriota bacterium]
MFFLHNLWMVPLLPAAGAVLMLLFGRRLGKSAVNAICVGAVLAAFAWSALSVAQFVHAGEPRFHLSLFTWIGSGAGQLMVSLYGGGQAEFVVRAGMLLDPLSAVWLLFVTGVGALIHIYSTGYMAHEGGYYRFFGYLNLFMFSMLTLILADNYLLMFVGWEGVGLCSYLLIGFYFDRHSASTAANKAFITNRVGDAGVLLGSFTIFWLFGSFDFVRVTELARANAAHLMGTPILLFATLALFVGACGKSAQIPLYIWLPDAMEGPTPVSALIHAATMVTAGVYMVARSNALFVLAPKTMMVVAVVGALTAFFAATIGLVQNDIKRVLAYSTVSQLGYMFLALGVGAFTAGVFHVFTHAFFKALLFLGSGSVIHAMSGEQDMRSMGALARKIPITFRAMLVGTLAIAGIPGLAGFFSKDEILWQAWSAHNGEFRILWLLGVVTALMTSFYMFRLIYLTFFGQGRMSHEVEHHIHESPRSMTVPLIVLALCSVFAGYLGVSPSIARIVGLHGQTNRFEHFLAPVFENHAEASASGGVVKEEAPEEESTPIEYGLMLLSVAAAVAGWMSARRAYANTAQQVREPIAIAAPPVYRTLLNKYYVDEAYDYAITGRRALGSTRLGAIGAGEALWKFDARVVDGGVNGAGWLTRFTGRVSSWWDKWIIDGLGVNGPAFVVRMMSYPTKILQAGLLQWYALVMIFGLAGLLWYYLFHLAH